MNKYEIITICDKSKYKYELEAFWLKYTDKAILFMDDNHKILHTAAIDKVIIKKLTND